MNCLILVPSLMRAGAETQAVDLANGLSSGGLGVHLCCFESRLDQRGRLLDTVKFHYIRRVRKYDFALVTGIAELIDREGIDLVLGVMQFAAFVAWLASRQSARQPAIVAALHTTINRGAKEKLQDRLIYRRILRRLPAVVFVCDYQRDYWTKKYPELKPLARVIHNGVDISRLRRDDFTVLANKLRSDLGISRVAFVFACIAAFRPEKGHLLLIKAFSQMPPDTYLLLAGDGPVRVAVEAAVRAAGLTNRVRFLGNVEDVRPVIVASNATVLPSTAVETFSMAMLESMALEVPMIASTIGGVAEAITHRETGLLCSPGNSGSLANQMQFLVERPAEAEKLGRAASGKISHCFTLEKMVLGYQAVVDEMLAAAGPPSISRK
jgi:glycosyltransferase involved in cell wall biosynthesis